MLNVYILHVLYICVYIYRINERIDPRGEETCFVLWLTAIIIYLTVFALLALSILYCTFINQLIGCLGYTLTALLLLLTVTLAKPP